MANKWFLSRNTASHYGDRIEFAAHHERSLTLDDAADLAAMLVSLIGDDSLFTKKLAALRPAPEVKPAEPPAPQSDKPADTPKNGDTAKSKSNKWGNK
jgi:hypothetical protein